MKKYKRTNNDLHSIHARRRTKTNTTKNTTQKTKKMSNTDPKIKRGTQVVVKDRQL